MWSFVVRLLRGKALPALGLLPDVLLCASGGACRPPRSVLDASRGEVSRALFVKFLPSTLHCGKCREHFRQAFVLDTWSWEASIDTSLCRASRQHRASRLDTSLCATSRHGSCASRHFLLCNVEASTLHCGKCREVRSVLILLPSSISRHFLLFNVETLLGGCVTAIPQV